MANRKKKVKAVAKKKKVLVYDDLKLGVLAKEALIRGESPIDIAGKYPAYLNTREVFAGLTVPDLAIAGVLAGMNGLYTGGPGCGKTQLMTDIYNGLFGGNKVDGGHGVRIDGNPELDVATEVFTKLNLDKAQVETTENISALIFALNEVNRCPPIAQNGFLGMGEGTLSHGGRSIRLGKDGYNVCLATANIGNGQFAGTFEIDSALMNRFGIVIDFNDSKYKPTEEDKMWLAKIRPADHKVKQGQTRDLSELIMKAQKEISAESTDLGLESDAVLNYLQFGLMNCQKFPNEDKDSRWPMNCQDCDKNTDGKTMCSLIKGPETRTVEFLRKYSAALDFVSKLKHGTSPDPVEIVFKAFELAGAYQGLLNGTVVANKHYGQAPRMMRDVCKELRADFEANSDCILNSVEAAKEGREVTVFYNGINKDGDEVMDDYNNLSDVAKENGEYSSVEPFTNNRPVGLEWVVKNGAVEREVFKLKGFSKIDMNTGLPKSDDTEAE